MKKLDFASAQPSPRDDRAMPRNPFLRLDAPGVAPSYPSLSASQQQAIAFAAAEIERDLASSQKHFVQALAFPQNSRMVISLLKALSGKFSWLLALDEEHFSAHALRMMGEGVVFQPIHDGWNQLLNGFTFASSVFEEMGVRIEGLTGELVQSLAISPPAPEIAALREEIERLLREPAPDEQLAMEKAAQYGRSTAGLNPVQKNDRLMALLSTRKGEVGGRPEHPVWQQIWAFPEFQDFYRRIMGFFQAILRELTQQRLRLKTLEKVFEASFLLPGAVAQHLDLILHLAKDLDPAFMTSPQGVPGLSEGQKMIVLTTSDQRLQSPTELKEKIRTLAQQHGISLGDIDARWNQEEPATS